MRVESLLADVTYIYVCYCYRLLVVLVVVIVLTVVLMSVIIVVVMVLILAAVVVIVLSVVVLIFTCYVYWDVFRWTRRLNFGFGYYIRPTSWICAGVYFSKHVLVGAAVCMVHV